MTQPNRSSTNQYVEAYKAGLQERETASRSVSRLGAAFEHVARWFGVDLRWEPSADNSAAGVSTMLPASTAPTRKPWVVSQLPA